MRQSLRLGSVSGIPIGINWGLLAIALLYMFNLAVGILPASSPGASTIGYWVFAGLGVIAFFGSIIAHEIGHSLVAQRNNIRVRAITLWLLGGVAQLEREADDPGVEFRIAIAGPAVSVALAFVFGALSAVASGLLGTGLMTVTLGYLAFINLALAIFNMIPAAPLDGGRVLAAAIWWRNGNRHDARAKAARAGEFFGNLLLTVGIIGMFIGAGTFIMAILGFFLRTAAGAERRRAEMLATIEHADVSTLMMPIAAPITSGVTISGLEAMTPHGSHVAFPLWSDDGIVGLVPSTAVAATPSGARGERRVEDVVIPWNEFLSARVGEPIEAVLERAEQASKAHVVVYDALATPVGYLPLTPSFAMLVPS